MMRASNVIKLRVGRKSPVLCRALAFACVGFSLLCLGTLPSAFLPQGQTPKSKPQTARQQQVSRVTDLNGLEQLLAIASAKLRRSEAFALPDADELRQEVASLETRMALIQQELKALEKPPTPVASDSESKAAGSDLVKDIDWEAFQAMPEQEQYDLLQRPQYRTSLLIVTICYWCLFGVAILAATGQSLMEFCILDSPQKIAGFVALFVVSALLKPLRTFAVVLMAPWTEERILPIVATKRQIK